MNASCWKTLQKKIKKKVLLTFAKGLKLQEKVFNTIQLKLYFCYFCLPSQIKNYAPIHLCILYVQEILSILI